MTERMMRGYMIQYSGRFILQDERLRTTVPAALIDEIEGSHAAIKPAEWCPAEQGVKLWRAIVATHTDDRKAQDDLERCGQAMGAYATGTFLKLLFKILTPRMFANKFPALYLRDNRGGFVEVESVDDHHLAMVLKDMAGYDHFGPIAQGWAGFTLRSIVAKKLDITCTPYSIAEPSPPEVRIVATW